MDLDAFGRSDSESIEAKMQVMDAFLWGRCLSEDEISAFYLAISPVDYYMSDLPEFGLLVTDSPPRVYKSQLFSNCALNMLVLKP